MTEEEGVEQEQVENPKAYLTPDYFYDDQKLFEESPAKTEFDTNFNLYNIFSFDLSRRYNAIPINETTVVITVGNFAMIYDLATGEEQKIYGHNKGVSCCAVHPNKEYIAFGEAGKDPMLLIYQYPSMKLFRVLKGGTEQAYTCMNFSPDGTMLAAVGTFPDYMLTVWDWERETLILRAKAFSQDVYRVVFSENLKGRLCTSGVGHIRLWEMAKTFTGLKLQGEIGKFGNIEISDTSGFAMFPDGKVLSGSESGSLLLWEDAFIKCEFVRTGGKRCHKDMIELVYHQGQNVITAGRDGAIRVWDFQTIDTAETEDTSVAIDLTQKAKLHISPNSSIKCMYPVGSEWLLVDEKQGIWRADIEGRKAELLQKFHSGAIRALSFSTTGSLFVTGGDDGFVRLWDISEKKLLSELKFEAPVTKILWVNEAGTDVIFAGFADGCLRIILATATGLTLKQPLKPHTGAVRDIQQSPTSKLVATTGDDGALFFLRFDDLSLEPLGFVYVNGKKPKTKEEITQEAISGKKIEDDKEYARGVRIRWGNMISVECSDGKIATIQNPTTFPEDSTESYFIDLPVETIDKGAADENITATYTVDEMTEIKGTKEGVIIYGGLQKTIHSAPITSISLSTDKVWLATASETGELFLFKQTQAGGANLQKQELKALEVAPVEDIQGTGYSIEEEKQKSELDRRIKAAEQQKSLIRKEIETLRQKFAALVQQNSKAPKYMQLDDQAFKIDPFLFDLMEEQAVALEKEASRNTMFAAEKSRVHFRKVKSRLVGDMTEESFTVTSTDGTKEVTSFRITELDPVVLEVIQQSTPNEQPSDEEGEQQESEAVAHADTESTISESSTKEQEQTVQKPTKANKFGRQPPLKKVVHTPDEHTRKREKRDRRRKKIMEQKPPANYSDPQDLKEIEIAKRTIGDYKLKDDPSYIAPENERVNATKKRRQLMMLLKAIQDLKLGFNQKLKDLAELKKNLQKSVDETNRQLLEIRGTIGYDPLHCELIRIHNKRFTPLVLNEKVDITIPTPDAIAFAEQVAAAARRRNEAQAGKQKQAAQPAHRQNAKRKQAQPQKKKKSAEEGPKFTEIEQIEMNELNVELTFKRKMLIANINKAIQKFNAKIDEIAVEKVKTQTEVVLAELRFILMLREFKLLSKLELKDAELNGKLRAKASEMKAISNEVAAHNKQIAQKTHEIEENEKEVKGFLKQFHEIVNPTHKFHDPLLRIFNFNMRKNQDKQNADEEEVDLTALDVDAIKKMFEKQNAEKEEDICPQGCDPALFEQVLDLREKRMDFQDKISEAQNAKEKIQRQIDTIQFKTKNLQTVYSQIKQEFEEFQHEKQRHLNELNFSLSIQFHQIKNLISKEIPQGEARPPLIVKSMPTDLSDSLIFTESGLKQLADQETKLRTDRESAHKLFEADVSSFKADKDTLDANMKQLEERQEKLAGIQRLKFGEPVDLVELEQMKVNKDADAVRAQTKEIETEQNAEMEEIIRQIKDMTTQLTQEIQRNTAVLGSLVQLTEQRRDIEAVLQNSRKTATADDLSQDLELTDPNELLQEVEKNNDIIEQLEEEIGLLKRR